eukprot:CAMPEP_0177239478 /NCGR_PEP_ID=MMETSP0367-20130122/47159_1 /TAXON_ID=447022 ORGANISM="Scrippsiella hangoei-like, Strain SHHI-4" /NCGR_SAMPLE_ID=MMETSP0367 /ASSEMBLY_ACC=CAM_ASM_000362 /LENGTH=31 /DNA_ID= /DNA_START= /DNA_END= /DNA_ORIENTATION=
MAEELLGTHKRSMQFKSCMALTKRAAISSSP